MVFIVARPGFVAASAISLVVVNREPLSSRIPETHPQKAAVEEVCARMLGELGSQWFISIRLTTDQVSWEVCLGWRRPDLPLRNRNWVVRPPRQDAGSIEKFLRETSSQLQRESEARFGMEPFAKLSEDDRLRLQDLLGQFGGRLHPDGWITLDDDKLWRRLEETVRDQLSIRLVASVR
jgi:hypothetical protein